jgi:hypothetical protein
LIPKQELVDKAEKSLPDRIQDYEKVRHHHGLVEERGNSPTELPTPDLQQARNELEEVIGEGCFFNNPCPGC